MGRHGDHVGAARRRPTCAERRAWLRFGAGVATLLCLVGVLFVGPAVVRSSDAAHRTTITCHVTAAEGEVRSTHSRGITRTTPQVVVSTSDCGELLVREGVTRTNTEQIATRFHPLGRYRIEVGAASWHIRHLLQAIRRDPLVYGFEPTS